MAHVRAGSQLEIAIYSRDAAAESSLHAEATQLAERRRLKLAALREHENTFHGAKAQGG